MIMKKHSVGFFSGLVFCGLIYSLVGLTIVLSSSQAFSEEGMWLFNHLPLQDLKQKYGFEPTDAWVTRVMKSSIRLNVGGSGSFISSQGLILTNHHVAADMLQKISTSTKDYYQDGFYAKTLAEEIKSPDMEINVLQSIEDVTGRVKGAVKSGMSADEARRARQAEISRIQNESLEKTGLRSDVVTLYGGGWYHLYRYKKYTDIRLVFAPEFAIAFFGGDPDNFEYPRYDLDMAVFRAYENGQPAHVENYLPFSQKGADDGELVFVTGHPGKTDRALTVAALKNLRDKMVPFDVAWIKRTENMLIQYRNQGKEQSMRGQEELFGIQNGRKVYLGRLEGLSDSKIFAQKRAHEEEMKSEIKKHPELMIYAEAWNKIEASERAAAGIFKEIKLIEYARGFRSTLFSIARTLVRIADEDLKPDSEKLPEYVKSARESLLQELLSSAPIYLDLEEAKLTDSLLFLVETLGADHTLVRAALGGKSPAGLARELIQGTKLTDVAERQRLLSGGKQAILLSGDPMIQFAVSVDDYARKIRKQYETQVTEPEENAYSDLTQVAFGLYGANRYPDATFTLRLSYGQVQGYKLGDQVVAPWTTIGGAFDYEAIHGGQPPYALPSSWHENKSELKPKTPFDFVSTNDIIGGNSGSPVVNRQGELVGLIFDGNIQSLVGDYIYDGNINRAVSVHSSAMLEALGKIYHADSLLGEIKNR